MNTAKHGKRELLLVFALFIASLPAVTARLYSSDEVEYFSYLRSLWFDHDVSFDNECNSPDRHAIYAEHFPPRTKRIPVGRDGRVCLV